MTPRRATFLTFLIVGIGIAAWAPLVPLVKARLALDDATLGAALLGLGGGSLAALPFAGILAQRFGAALLCRVAGLIYCIALPALALAPSAMFLAGALAVFGAALGTIDVAMNAAAVVVERDAARPLMSGFHGGYSLGGLLGAAAASLLLAVGMPPVAMAGLMAALCAAILLAATPHVPAAQEAGGKLAWPRGRLLLIGLLCCIGFLAEGAVLDWSAVLLRFHRAAGTGMAGLGFAAFSLTMAVCRLSGDAVVRRFSPVRVLVGGSVLAAAGFVLAASVASVPAGLAGCALIGIGCANVVPVLFAAAGRMPGLPPGLAIAAVATPGYAGLLAGPAAVGIAADAVGLPMAFAAVGALMLVVAACAARALNPQMPQGKPT